MAPGTVKGPVRAEPQHIRYVGRAMLIAVDPLRGWHASRSFVSFSPAELQGLGDDMRYATGAESGSCSSRR